MASTSLIFIPKSDTDLIALSKKDRLAYFWEYACKDTGVNRVSKKAKRYPIVKDKFVKLIDAYNLAHPEIEPTETELLAMSRLDCGKAVWALACKDADVKFARAGTDEYDKVHAYFMKRLEKLDTLRPKEVFDGNVKRKASDTNQPDAPEEGQL